MDRVSIDPITGCWEWKLGKDTGGYTYITNKKGHMILLTKEEVLRHMNVIRLKHGYIWDEPSKSYWKEPPGSGVTEDKAQATRSTMENLWYTVQNWGGHPLLFEMVDQDIAERIKKIKCNARTVLGADLIQLLGTAPENLTFRAMVMAAVGQMPPAELNTAELICNWVEETYDPAKVPKAKNPVPIQARQSFNLPVRFRQPVRGIIIITGLRQAVLDYNLQPAIDQWLEENAGVPNLSSRHLQEYLRRYMESHAYGDMDPGLELDHNSINYLDEDLETTSEIETTCTTSPGSMEQYIRDHIQYNYPPELRRRFGF